MSQPFPFLPQFRKGCARFTPPEFAAPHCIAYTTTERDGTLTSKTLLRKLACGRSHLSLSSSRICQRRLAQIQMDLAGLICVVEDHYETIGVLDPRLSARARRQYPRPALIAR